MDKILSARVDDSVIRRIGSLARQLRTSKKRIIEEAIEMYAVKVETDGESDILDQTFGVWQRKEPAAETVRKIRKTFNESQSRSEQ